MVTDMLEQTETRELPLTTRFTLGTEITEEQKRFLDRHGFLVFAGVASLDEVDMIDREIRAIESRWLEERRSSIYGVPLFIGKDPDGKDFIQRIPFTSQFSEAIRSFVRHERFEPIRQMFGPDARIGDDEKDGFVANRYVNVPGSVYPRLGWHTDGLRDLFYGRMPGPMLNVGLHLDRIKASDGGLRLIPGTHKQGFWKMCFYKPYFVSHGADAEEIVVETEPGDLTIHDGRLWHRVERSDKSGWDSLRRSMYVPYVTGDYEPKTEQSGTPFYHHLGRLSRGFKKLFS